MRPPYWLGPLVMGVGALIWSGGFWPAFAVGFVAILAATIWPVARHRYLVRSVSGLVADLPAQVAALAVALRRIDHVGLAQAQLLSLGVVRRLDDLEHCTQALGLNGGLQAAIGRLRDAIHVVMADGQLHPEEASDLLELTHQITDAFVAAVYREAQVRPIWQVSAAVRRGLASFPSAR